MLQKTIYILFSLILSLSASSQNNVSGNEEPLYIDILVSPSKTVSINNHVNILPKNIKKTH